MSYAASAMMSASAHAMSVGRGETLILSLKTDESRQYGKCFHTAVRECHEILESVQRKRSFTGVT